MGFDANRVVRNAIESAEELRQCYQQNMTAPTACRDQDTKAATAIVALDTSLNNGKTQLAHFTVSDLDTLSGFADEIGSKYVRL